MSDKEWIQRAKKLLKAIKFNAENHSTQRLVIGGNELEIIDELLGDAQ